MTKEDNDPNFTLQDQPLTLEEAGTVAKKKYYQFEVKSYEDKKNHQPENEYTLYVYSKGDKIYTKDSKAKKTEIKSQDMSDDVYNSIKDKCNEANKSTSLQILSNTETASLSLKIYDSSHGTYIKEMPLRATNNAELLAAKLAQDIENAPVSVPGHLQVAAQNCYDAKVGYDDRQVLQDKKTRAKSTVLPQIDTDIDNIDAVFLGLEVNKYSEPPSSPKPPSSRQNSVSSYQGSTALPGRETDDHIDGLPKDRNNSLASMQHVSEGNNQVLQPSVANAKVSTTLQERGR